MWRGVCGIMGLGSRRNTTKTFGNGFTGKTRRERGHRKVIRDWPVYGQMDCGGASRQHRGEQPGGKGFGIFIPVSPVNKITAHPVIPDVPFCPHCSINSLSEQVL